MNPLDRLLKFHLGQHVYFWFMLPLHGIVVVLQSMSKFCINRLQVHISKDPSVPTVALVEGVYHTPMSSFVKRERMLDLSALMVHVIRWIFLPVARTGTFSVIINCVSYCKDSSEAARM